MRPFILGLSLLSLVGCTTVQDLGGGRYRIPEVVEKRSPFGTNVVIARMAECDGKPDPKMPGMLYENCEGKTDWHIMSSQGQGGQIMSGLLNAAGFWGLGALMPGSSMTSTSSSSATGVGVGTVIQPPHGHK